MHPYNVIKKKPTTKQNQKKPNPKTTARKESEFTLIISSGNFVIH